MANQALVSVKLILADPRLTYTDLICSLCEEEAQDHDVGKWQEEVDMGVVLVLLHKEVCSKTQIKQPFVISWH